MLKVSKGHRYLCSPLLSTLGYPSDYREHLHVGGTAAVSALLKFSSEASTAILFSNSVFALNDHLPNYTVRAAYHLVKGRLEYWFCCAYRSGWNRIYIHCVHGGQGYQTPDHELLWLSQQGALQMTLVPAWGAPQNRGTHAGATQLAGGLFRGIP